MQTTRANEQKQEYRCAGGFYRRNDIAIGVSHLPNNKRPCLCVQTDNILTKVASFDSERAAALFMERMDLLLEGLIQPNEREE